MNGQLNNSKEKIKIIDNNIKSEDAEKPSSNIINNNQINQIFSNQDGIPKYIPPIPDNKNLLDNYDIIKYKNIIMPRIQFDNNNEYNLEYYKKIFNNFFKKINNDFYSTLFSINSISKISDNKLKLNSNNKYENIIFDNKIKNESFSILSKEKNNIINKSNISISDNEVNNTFVLGDNKNNIIDTVFNDDYFSKGNIVFNDYSEIDYQCDIDINKKSNYKREMFNVSMPKKRGRIPLKKEVLHVHSALDDDNILRKIQVHFLSFLISFTNDYIGEILPNPDKKNNIHFKHIDYKYKRTINHNSIERIKTLTIGEILQFDISQKYKKSLRDINRITYNKIRQLYPDLTNKYFNMLFKEFFIEYYYNKNNGFIFVDGIKVHLSNKTRAFNDLIRRNIKNSQKFREIATYFYLNNINGNGNDINNNDEGNEEDQKGQSKKTFFLIE